MAHRWTATMTTRAMTTGRSTTRADSPMSCSLLCAEWNKDEKDKHELVSVKGEQPPLGTSSKDAL